ncbi:MAG: hypothetical protein JXA03_06850 [Bacteroidales bacterium]|nr:hypothetical protein [Bacteroidales bacterium]
MKPSILLLLLTALFLAGQTVFSQDQIYKRNNDSILCKVKEVGTEDIKYSLPGYPEDLVFSIDREKVLKIVFENGKEMVFEKEMINPENYADNKKNAFKVDFLSPLTGNTTFWYERSLKPGSSLEAALGIIGLGVDPDNNNPRGAFFKFGYKAIRRPDFYLKGMRYAHILKGAYIRPEISVGYYSLSINEDYYYYYYDRKKVRKEYFAMALHLNFGKQWVFNNSLLVDWFAGVGYGFDSEGEGRYHFGWASADRSLPVSGTAGLKVGFLFD